MLAARVRSALSRIALGRALIALAVVLVGINVCSAIWDLSLAKSRTERRALRDFSNTTRLLAEQTAASLEAVDLMLRAVGTTPPTDALALEPKLRDELARMPHIASLAV